MPRTPLLVLLCASLGAAEDGWTVILDEASFRDWTVMPGDAAQTVVERDGVQEVRTADGEVVGSWTFADGVLTSGGGVSHIFSPRDDYADVRFRAEISIGDQSNSGMYFRAKLGHGWPDGYEAQINANFGDPTKSGSLYGIVQLTESPVKPDTWHVQEVLADGDHIVISIDGKPVVDTRHDQRTSGHVAFQQHHQGSVVRIRDVRVMELTKGE